MIPFAIIFLVVYLGANAFLAWRIFTALDMLPVWVRVVVVVAISAMALMLFASIGLRNVALPEGLMRAMFNIGSVWLVFLLYSILAITLFDVVHWVVPSLRWRWYFPCWAVHWGQALCCWVTACWEDRGQNRCLYWRDFVKMR